MLTCEEFYEEVRMRVSEWFGEGCSAELRDFRKNNGIVLCGLVVETEGSKVMPTVYLNAYYDQYQRGMKLEEAVDDIVRLIADDSGTAPVELDKVLDFENVRGLVVCRLINLEANRELLQELPHRPFQDLAVIYALMLGENGAGKVTAVVQNDHMELWGVTEEELYRAAIENMPKLFPVHLNSIKNVMKEIAKDSMGDLYCEELLDALLGEVTCPLYVLSNVDGIYGAAVMLYPDVLQHTAKALGADLIILPSSIHEVLVYADHDGRPDYESLAQMVRCINRTEVQAEDVLSGSVYRYSRQNGTMETVCHG